jgi:hypothetical protein
MNSLIQYLLTMRSDGTYNPSAVWTRVRHRHLMSYTPLRHHSSYLQHTSNIHTPVGISDILTQVDSKGFSWWCITLGITGVFGLCPSSGILKTREHNVLETGPVSVLRWRGETPTQLSPLERVNLSLQWLRLALSKRPNWVGVSCPLSPEDGNRSSFQNVMFSSF